MRIIDVIRMFSHKNVGEIQTYRDKIKDNEFRVDSTNLDAMVDEIQNPLYQIGYTAKDKFVRIVLRNRTLNEKYLILYFDKHIAITKNDMYESNNWEIVRILEYSDIDDDMVVLLKTSKYLFNHVDGFDSL